MIDTFSYPKSRDKKPSGIIIINFFLRRTNDPCNSRNFNFDQLSANRQPTLCSYRRPLYPQTSPQTIWSAIKHTLTLQEVLSRFLGLQRKPFRSRSEPQ